MSEDSVGRIVDGRYVVEATLGSGGMGVVLRARHRYTGAFVALKMLRPHLQLDAAVQERFLAEARAPSAIGHPGIVSVLDAGRTPEGELYLAMELLEGVPLRNVARGGLPQIEIRRIVLELLDALGAAHARGVVHRDLKPENVFLVGPTRTVKLLDFGIAKIVQSSPDALHRTAAGDLLGTLAYMAPEQLRDASKVDPRADLWAVGVMMYEMLSGQLPYRGDTMQALYVSVLTKQPDPITAYLPNVPPALVAFFARALAVDPAQRFTTARELAAAVAALPLASVAGFPSVAVTGASLGTDATGYAPSTAPPIQAYGSNAPPPVHAYGSNLGSSAPVVGFVAPITQAPPTYGSSTPAGVAPGRTTITQAPLAPRSKWPLAAVAIAAIAAAAAVAIALAARGGGEPRPVVVVVGSAAGSGSAIGITTPTIDATDVWGGDPVDDEHASACAKGCASLQSCDLAYTACVLECGRTPSFTECFAVQDCTARAACIFGKNCGGARPSGTTTCRTAAICQVSCADDPTCICGCIARTAPTHVVPLFRLDACAANCMNDPACVARDCQALANACN